MHSCVLPKQTLLLSLEGLDISEKIVTGIGIDFHYDGFAQIQAENTQNRLGVHHMTASAQVHIVGVTVHNVNEGLDVLREAELDLDRLHIAISPLSVLYGVIIHHDR